MKNIHSLSTAFMAFLLSITDIAAADALTEKQAIALVQPLYDILNGEPAADAMRETFSPDWQSYYSSTGYKGLEETIGFLQAFSTSMVPDLSWDIKDVLLTGDGNVIVRGEAKGTPVGDQFFGAPIDGKSFNIMSIDIHTIEKRQGGEKLPH